jgi:anti-anti-sigma factor
MNDARSLLHSVPAPRVAAADRCPHRRPFPKGFAACPAHQAVAFVPTDTMSHPLRTQLTCRHLTTGTQAGSTGTFYPRCSLGSEAERMRWLAMVTPARLEVMRALQVEFDAVLTARRDALFRARAAQLAAPDSRRCRAELEAAVQAFVDGAATFVAEREERFADVGLPTAALVKLVEEMCWAWARTRPVAARGGEERIEVFPVASQPFLGSVAEAPWRDRGAAEPLLDVPGLRLTRDRHGVLGLHGELDARNAERLGAALEEALSGPGERHLDASGLLFCGVAGLRILVRAAQRLGPGARLVVHGMPESTRRAMALVGWAEVPNLVVVAGSEVNAA